jgi:hypothetical protein
MIVVIEVRVVIAFKIAAIAIPSIAPPRPNPPPLRPAPDQARAADLDVFDLAVRDLGENIGPMRGEHQQPVLAKPHITPFPRRDGRLGDIPAEIDQIAQAGDGAGVELEQLAGLQRW